MTTIYYDFGQESYGVSSWYQIVDETFGQFGKHQVIETHQMEGININNGGFRTIVIIDHPTSEDAQKLRRLLNKHPCLNGILTRTFKGDLPTDPYPRVESVSREHLIDTIKEILGE